MIYNYFSGNLNVIEYSHRCAISSAILVFLCVSILGGVGYKVLVNTPDSPLKKFGLNVWLSGLFVESSFRVACWIMLEECAMLIFSRLFDWKMNLFWFLGGFPGWCAWGLNLFCRTFESSWWNLKRLLDRPAVARWRDLFCSVLSF